MNSVGSIKGNNCRKLNINTIIKRAENLHLHASYRNKKADLWFVFGAFMWHLYLICQLRFSSNHFWNNTLDPQQARSCIHCQMKQAVAADGCSVWHQLKMIAVKIKLKGQRPTWLLALNSPCRRKLLLEPRAISKVITAHAYYHYSTF